MSRTYRNVGKANDPRNELSWITEDDCVWVGCHRVYLPREFLRGKAYRKAWWTYHRDHHRSWRGCGKLFRSDWGAVRTKNRNNLISHLRDDDRECFFWEDVNTKEWD